MRQIILILVIVFLSKPGFANEVLLLDDFNDGDFINKFGTISGVFESINPSTGTCIARIYSDNPENIRGSAGYSLELTYNVSNTDSSSGYFSKLADKDISPFKYLSFWVKGKEGGEFFKIEIRNNSPDNNRNKAAVYVTDYLDGGVTTSWQKVIIPLDAFANIGTWTGMSEFVIVFENYQSRTNNSTLTSTIYIDDILFGSYFIGCVRIDHYGDKIGIDALGGNMGNMAPATPTKTYSFATSTYHFAPNSLLSEYDVTAFAWSGVFNIFGGGADGWTKIPSDFSKYDRVSFWIKARSEEENPKEIRVELDDPACQFNKFVRFGNITTQWQKMSKLLTECGVDKSKILEMDFVFESDRIQLAGGNKIGAVYIDDVQFEKGTYTPDTISPSVPTNLKNNGIPLADGHILGRKNVLTVNADSATNDNTLESVRFEYSNDAGITWHTIGTDYDLTDTTYEVTWYIVEVDTLTNYSIRTVAQDVAGNEISGVAYHNCKIELKEGVNYIFDNFDDQNIGFNDFCGNWGELMGDYVDATFSTTTCYGTKGASLKIEFYFPGGTQTYTNFWESIWGHSDYSEYSLDFTNIYGSLTIEEKKDFDYLSFMVRGSGQTQNIYNIKVELKDNRLPKDERNNYKAYKYISLHDSDTNWKRIILDADVTNAEFWSYNKYPPCPTKMKELVFVIESQNNPGSGSFYIDNICFVDEDNVCFEVDSHTDDEFLEFISRRTFKYFLDFADPESGLILDRSTFPDLISIAATGFGLTALCIGSEKGWIDRDMAYNRALKIIQTCLDIQAKQETNPVKYGNWGFFYHFLDPGTSGNRFIPPKRKMDSIGTGSELSSIDTALLIAGALTAGEYFGGEIKTKAETLHSNVQWDKFLYSQEMANQNGWPWYGTYSNQFFSAWKPGDEYSTSLYQSEDGKFTNRFFDLNRINEPFTWDYYTDEIILICLLAIASPTHPVETETFYAWGREWGTYSIHSLIQSQPGALFTYFFAQCWINFKGLGIDNHSTTPIDWFENAVNATNANWQYCQDKSYQGWGLTACEGPDGNYYAYGSPPCGEVQPKDDGTLAPYGAGSAIIFKPTKSIETLKHYFKDTDLFRYLFGFGDAYNPHNTTVINKYNGPWDNHVYFGIDQGPMLIMIENYRSELIWKYFMQNEGIKSALIKIFPSPRPNVIITKKARNITQRGIGVEYFDPELYLEGHTIEFAILVENIGLGTATNVVVTDTLPDGITYNGTITGKGADDSNAPNLKWNIGTITPNTSETLTFQSTVNQYYTRECEYPDEYTVGQMIWRSNASGLKVHGEFGCESSSPWSAKAGYVKYNNIKLNKTDHLYLILRYSKYSGSITPIRIYLDEETEPRATFYPINQGNWNSFTQTNPIDLGSVNSGIHSLKFTTDGQQYGVANLDKFTLF